MEGGGVCIASDDLIAQVDSYLPVCSEFTTDDIDGWERFLDAAYDPETWGQRLELQNRNDCRANAGTTCVELIDWRSNRRKNELSRMWFYQSCEILDRKFGADSGVSVQAGVELMAEHGAPLEELYPYTQYTRNRRQFDAWCTVEVMDDAKKRRIPKSSLAPAWEVAIAHVVLGHPLDMASFWPLSFSHEDIGRGKAEPVVRQYDGRHGSAGHAFAGVFVVRTPRGELLLKVHNSHKYYFYVSQAAYEQMRNRRNNPFGMYQHAGAADPLAAYYDGQFSIMGLD